MDSNRRNFLKFSALAATLAACNRSKEATEIVKTATKATIKPIVISTWKFGVEANAEAWKILSEKGRALDAVEAGVKIPEADPKNEALVMAEDQTEMDE
jgi:N4-(beta-N-acetylglucosaminyl)-L-asparaginase